MTELLAEFSFVEAVLVLVLARVVAGLILTLLKKLLEFVRRNVPKWKETVSEASKTAWMAVAEGVRQTYRVVREKSKGAWTAVKKGFRRNGRLMGISTATLIGALALYGVVESVVENHSDKDTSDERVDISALKCNPPAFYNERPLKLVIRGEKKDTCILVCVGVYGNDPDDIVTSVHHGDCN